MNPLIVVAGLAVFVAAFVIMNPFVVATAVVVVLVAALLLSIPWRQADKATGSRIAFRHNVEHIINYARQLSAGPNATQSEAVTQRTLSSAADQTAAGIPVRKAQSFNREHRPQLSENAKRILERVYAGAREMPAQQAGLRETFPPRVQLSNGPTEAGGLQNPATDRAELTLDVKVAERLGRASSRSST